MRTLHYYDEIGLLKPSEVDAQNGYRFYDEKSLERMQEILFYRELDFSLKTVAEILSSPDYDKQQALSRQRRLLLAKKERLEQLIMAIDSVEKGEGFMKTKNEYEVLKSQYAEEVKQRWGNTAAYKEFERRHTDHSQAVALLDAVFEEFAELNRAATSTPAPTTSSKAWGGCMSPTTASGKISTGTARARRRLFRRVSNSIFNNISGRVSKYACTFLFYIAARAANYNTKLQCPENGTMVLR